jgi:hypothetical protein
LRGYSHTEPHTEVWKIASGYTNYNSKASAEAPQRRAKVSYSSEIYHFENGKEVIEERIALNAQDLPAAEREATEWVAGLGSVLYRSTYVRIRQNGIPVRERALGEEAWA